MNSVSAQNSRLSLASLLQDQPCSEIKRRYAHHPPDRAESGRVDRWFHRAASPKHRDDLHILALRFADRFNRAGEQSIFQEQQQAPTESTWPFRSFSAQ